MPLPANLPDVETAKLPALYEAAKSALSQCLTIDECRTWANRMEAVASYARQADDDTLMKHAMRIKARAIERTGELLREIEPASGNQHTLGRGVSTEHRGRFAAAREAGLSKDQAVTALRVNNVPKDQFEAMVDGANPPTVTELARIGTKRRDSDPEPHYLKGRTPGDFQQATSLLGLLGHIVRYGKPIDLMAAVRGLDEGELAEARVRLDDATDVIRDIKDALQSS